MLLDTGILPTNLMTKIRLSFLRNLKVTKLWFMIGLVIALVGLELALQSQILAPRASVASRNEYLETTLIDNTPEPTPFQPVLMNRMYLPVVMVDKPVPMVSEPAPVAMDPVSIDDQPIVTATQQAPVAPRPTPTLQINFTDEKGRSWQDYAGPSVWPDLEIPGPVGILSHPEGQLNILLLGSDQRPDESGFRTDTIQLLTINEEDNTVKLTSFPRDLYVYIPGYTMQRINTAMGWGGFEALAQTMEYNFGVRPDHYVLINFWSFMRLIDEFGGIRVDVGRDFCDHRDAFGQYCVSQSTVWMDGETTLWYVRSRYTSSDLDRGRRQQEVLKAIFQQMMTLKAFQHAPQLYEAYKQNVTTDMDFMAITRLFPVAYNLYQNHSIEGYSIGEQQVYDWTTYGGAMVLVPIREKVLEIMRQVISEP